MQKLYLCSPDEPRFLASGDQAMSYNAVRETSVQITKEI